MADPAGHRHHLHDVRRHLRVAAQTRRHRPDDSDFVHRGLPDVRMVRLHLRPGRLRGLRPAVRHRRQRRHLPDQRGGQLGRKYPETGNPALPESLQPQNRAHSPDHRLDRSGTGSLPLRRSRGGFWFAFAVAAISGTLFSILALVVYLPIFLPMRRKTRKTV